MNQPKKYFISTVTIGCINSLAENERHRNEFNSLGYVASKNAEDADIILVNTCAVIDESETASVDTIVNYKNRYPNKEIQVAGCLPKINVKKIKEIHQGKIISFPDTNPFDDKVDSIGNSDLATLPNFQRFVLKMRIVLLFIENTLGLKFPLLSNICEGSILNPRFKYITVSHGCLGQCTFCGIKRSKGKLVSRTEDSISRQFESLLAKGEKNIWLLGDDLGCWGQDLNSNISHLLSKLLATPVDFSLVINFLDPTYLVQYQNELIKCLSDPRIISVCIPLQSGSPKILERMKRYYNPHEVKNILAIIKKNNPSICLRTNYIAGFPDETWSDLLKSIATMGSYDAIYTLKYSAKPFTLAAAYPNQIPERSKKMRTNLMNLISHFIHCYVGAKSLLTPKRAKNNGHEAWATRQ
jgi:MiaB/RimO family radical SAM methylthiotransferase